MKLPTWRRCALTAAVVAVQTAALQEVSSQTCGCGNIEEPLQVARVHYKELAQASWECPLVIQGLEDVEGWSELAKYGKVETLESLARKTISFDVSRTSEFRYWDNASALAESVRNAGVVIQGYEKIRAPRKTFFRALQDHGHNHDFARLNLHWISRHNSALTSWYGGPVSGILPNEVKSKVDAKVKSLGLFADGMSTQSLLWLSSAGSYSSAHYDNFHTTFVMLAGEKEFLLSPPRDVADFHPYPGAHPMARQARHHFLDVCLAVRRGYGNVLDMREEVKIPRLASVCAATLKSDEALRLPAGWLHHVTAHSTSIAFAFTSLPREFHDFNKWITQPEEVLPFLKADSIEWTTGKIAAALLVFVPKLLAELGFNAGSANALDIVFNRSYSPATLAELGVKRDVSRQVPSCKSFPTASLDIVHSAVIRVAAKFKVMTQDLRLMYLLPYLETIFSKVAGPEMDPAVIMTIAARFVQKCLGSQQRG